MTSRKPGNHQPRTEKPDSLSLSPVEKVEAFELLFASPSFIQKFIEIRRTYQTIHP